MGMTDTKPRVRVNRDGITLDGLTNVIAGLGRANPKIAASTYMASFSRAEADLAFRTSTWYGKILTIPVDDAVRAWRNWQAEKDQIEKLEAEEKRLSYRLRVREALLVARHRGGAVIIPGGLPGANDQPLRVDQVVAGSIDFLHVMGRDEITPGQIVRDPFDPMFGKPEKWTVNGSGGVSVDIDASRVTVLNGRSAPGSQVGAAEFWGDPIWLHMADAIMAADAGAAVISALMHEAKIDIVKVPDLATLLTSPGGDTALAARWNLVAQMKSIANIMLIDGGPVQEGTKSEEWEQKQISWDGLPEVQRVLLQVMAGAADIPITRLTGEQQTGLSGGDEGSIRHYYDMVAAKQELELAPMLASLDELLIRSALGERPEDIWYQWAPLWQPDTKTQAETDKLEAETAAIYARDALVPSPALEAAVQNRMIESGRWPGLEAALEELPEDYEEDPPHDPADPDVEDPDVEDPADDE